MPDKKFIAIGDIHGCADTLETMLESIDEYTNRIYVFLGDYIDRGPDSRRVIDLLLDFEQSHQCVWLRGNHEQMLLEAMESDDYSLWLYNGGEATIRSYIKEFGSFQIPDIHETFYKDTTLYFDTSQYFFVHAGLNPNRTIKDSLKHDRYTKEFLWDRSHLQTNDNVWEKTVVFGHTPMMEPLLTKNMIGIDTGCVYGESRGMGKLTAVLLPEIKFIQKNCTD
ncbi:MAG TPA: metallophosphoesterase family protein [Balneolales bacterium]|nr:metallophosphoesterase family protein [Balneolales bacterium]